MAKSAAIKTFRGIAPKYGNALPVGMATVAQNVDLSSGKIEILPSARRSMPTNLYPATSMNWPIGYLDIAISISGGVLKKTVGGVTADLGQAVTAAPSAVLNGAGLITGEVSYFTTTIRNIGGHIDESGPSPVTASLTCAANKVDVTRAYIPDSHVTHWNLYRITSTEYLLVGQYPGSTLLVTDNTAAADLGVACPTYYTSNQGNEIVWAKPATGIEGITPEPHSGLIFAWVGSRLLWNDSGYPDAWPASFYMDFPANIKRAMPFGGALGVFTELGPFRVDGTNPELLVPSRTLGNEPCAGTAAYPTRKGVLYHSDSGLANYNLVDCPVVTDEYFGEEWFTANISPIGSELVENDGYVYLQHSAGILLGDMRISKRPIWTTLPLVAATTGAWRSGDLLGDSDLAEFLGVKVQGEGAPTVNLYVDGALAGTKILDLDGMERDRLIKLGEGINRGRALQVEFIVGETDKITEMLPIWA